MKYIFFVFILLLTFNQKSKAQALKDCQTCSAKTITADQIKNLSIDEIRFLTNDLFAREGYRFDNSAIDMYFSNQPWYKPGTSNDKIIYNAVEKQNIKLFQDRTIVLKEERERLMSALRSFKLLVLAGDKAKLMSLHGYDSGDTENTQQFRYLTESLQKLNLDDLNWLKKKGIYHATIDNGNIVMDYEIEIKDNDIRISYGNQGGSEIMEMLYPSDYNIEFNYWWDFKWNNGTLKFLKMDMAG